MPTKWSSLSWMSLTCLPVKPSRQLCTICWMLCRQQECRSVLTQPPLQTLFLSFVAVRALARHTCACLLRLARHSGLHAGQCCLLAMFWATDAVHCRLHCVVLQQNTHLTGACVMLHEHVTQHHITVWQQGRVAALIRHSHALSPDHLCVPNSSACCDEASKNLLHTVPCPTAAQAKLAVVGSVEQHYYDCFCYQDCSHCQCSLTNQRYSKSCHCQCRQQS